MPAPVHSVRFAAAHALTGTASMTVPSGKVWILRDIDAFVTGGPAGSTIAAKGSAGQILWAVFLTTTSGDYFAWRGRQVLEQGETWSLVASIGTWDVTASGYELTLP